MHFSSYDPHGIHEKIQNLRTERNIRLISGAGGEVFSFSLRRRYRCGGMNRFGEGKTTDSKNGNVKFFHHRREEGGVDLNAKPDEMNIRREVERLDLMASKDYMNEMKNKEQKNKASNQSDWIEEVKKHHSRLSSDELPELAVFLHRSNYRSVKDICMDDGDNFQSRILVGKNKFNNGSKSYLIHSDDDSDTETMEESEDTVSSTSTRSKSIDEDDLIKDMIKPCNADPMATKSIGRFGERDGTTQPEILLNQEVQSNGETPNFTFPSMPLTYSGSIISLGTLARINSAQSFAFPVLVSEWNSSPVRMANAKRTRRWRLPFLCCKF